MSERFLKDNNIDNMITDIIDIFNTDGVELVRLSGLLVREKKISGHNDLTPEVLDSTIKKLKLNGIINYKFIMMCPYCQEVSYQVIERKVDEPKFCDTCKTIYSLIDGTTLIRGQ